MAINKELLDNIPKELYHFIKVLDFGYKKYGDGKIARSSQLLSHTSPKLDHKSMHESMFRHLAKSQCGIRLDDESGYDHLLHLACRALICYYRISKGASHKDNKEGNHESI